MNHSYRVLLIVTMLLGGRAVAHNLSGMIATAVADVTAIQ
jgi:hypothetical protein